MATPFTIGVLELPFIFLAYLIGIILIRIGKILDYFTPIFSGYALIIFGIIILIF